jgi:L-ascorbate metabolism protein UlaG (beta-lactamase superfamily)
MAGTLTWLGHAAFRLDSPGGKRIYIDPFLQNPKCPENERSPERADVIALTHGHDDHVGDTVSMSQQLSPEAVVAQVELKGWLGAQGAKLDAMPGPNKGGTIEAAGCQFTLTNAFHSSSTEDGGYAGESCGIVIELEDRTKVYFAGDTCVFGDMQLIARIYEPDVAVLPIGGHFTMGPREAALALELLGNPRCVPCHWGTFPLLTGTPQKLKELAPGANIVDIEPGQTVEL